jgi:1-acyl-sn-glycerol-3-phosphate acyltransferase
MKYLYSVYAWVFGGFLFVLILLIGIVLMSLLPPKKFKPLINLMFRFLILLLFIRVKVEGKQNLISGEVCIFMANHSSIFDILILASYLPGYYRGVESHNQFSWPLWGFALKRYGNIPINRDSVNESLASIRFAKNVILEERTSILILPEGHLSLDGKMMRFKKFPFLLAKEAGVPIVPIGISGTFKVKRKGSWIISPQKIFVRFGDTISAQQVNYMDIQALLEYTRDRIHELLGKLS